jgi:small subunit ribosomal protein S8
MDPIADAITIIRNGYLAGKQTVGLPYSRLKKEVAEKIASLGFLDSVKVNEKERQLEISLRYREGKPVLFGIERVSKPSLRVYRTAKKIPRVLSGRGEVILSTPKGVLTGAEARKLKLGGEILLKIW